VFHFGDYVHRFTPGQSGAGCVIEPEIADAAPPRIPTRESGAARRRRTPIQPRSFAPLCPGVKSSVYMEFSGHFSFSPCSFETH
jgi:hypothetical protein